MAGLGRLVGACPPGHSEQLGEPGWPFPSLGFVLLPTDFWPDSSPRGPRSLLPQCGETFMSLDILQAWAWLEMAITVCCCTGRGFCLFLAGLAGASMPLPSLATLLLFSLAVEEETALFLAAKRGIGIRGNGKVGSGSLGKVLLAWLAACPWACPFEVTHRAGLCMGPILGAKGWGRTAKALVLQPTHSFPGP